MPARFLLGKAWKGHIVSVKVSIQGMVDVRDIVLHTALNTTCRHVRHSSKTNHVFLNLEIDLIVLQMSDPRQKVLYCCQAP